MRIKLQPQYWTNHPIEMSLPSSPAKDAKKRARLWLENRKRHLGGHAVPGSTPKVVSNF